MASLLNKYIYETYKGLIKTLDNEPIDGALKPLSDGEGNELPIKVSDTDVEVGFLTSKNVFIEAYGEVIDQNGNWVGPQQGFAGTSGTSGTNGQNGSSGTSGKNGTTGVSGSSGTSGKNGTNGSSGTSGVNGSSGQTGSAGTSGTSGLSALGLPSKVITTDNQGWTFADNKNTKTFTFNSAFANTNYSADFTWDVSDLPNQVFSNTGAVQIEFINKTTTSITVVVYLGTPISNFTFNGFLTLIASGESNGSGTSGTSGMTGAQGPQGANGTSGTSGQNGTSGANGTSGTSGISQPGTPGTSGTSGTSGNGTSGTSGTSGINGISTGRTYFFNNSQNAGINTYKLLSPDPTATAQQTVTKTLTNQQQNVLVQEFITPSLGFTVIPGGVQRFHLHYKKPAQNDNIETYVTLQLADSAGVPYGPAAPTNAALIGWTDNVNPVEVEIDLVLPTTAILATDRVIVKIYLNNLDSTSHTVNWYTEGSSNYSYVTTTVAPTTGTSGTSGTNGTSGTSGVNGAQGPQGANGSSGTSGLTGATGTSGTSGTSGGGGVDIYNSITTPTIISGGLSWYKLNVPALSFGLTAQSISINNVRFTPVLSLLPGEIIKDVAIYIQTAVASSTVALGLYSVSLDANGAFYASTLVSNFGTIDSSTTGRKTITGVNVTIPTSVNNIYYVGLLQVGGASAVAVAGPTNGLSPAYFASLNATVMDRAMSVQSTGVSYSALPSSISAATWATYTNNTTYIYVGFKS